MATKVAFVDRDGTIIWEPEKPEGFRTEDTFPLSSPQQVKLLPGAIDGLKKLKKLDYKLVLVTNQTYLGTERHPQDVFDSVMDKLESELESEGIEFDYKMICPHGPNEGCGCRKPEIGGVQGYIDSLEDGLDVSNSVMFGDRDSDGVFASRLGVQFVKVNCNKEFKLPEELNG